MQRESSEDDESVAMPEREALATPTRLAPWPRRRLLVRLGIATATVVLLGVALALANAPLPNLTTLFPTPFSPPSGWQRYADPDKSFRVWSSVWSAEGFFAGWSRTRERERGAASAF